MSEESALDRIAAAIECQNRTLEIIQTRLEQLIVATAGEERWVSQADLQRFVTESKISNRQSATRVWDVLVHQIVPDRALRTRGVELHAMELEVASLKQVVTPWATSKRGADKPLKYKGLGSKGSILLSVWVTTL